MHSLYLHFRHQVFSLTYLNLTLVTVYLLTYQSLVLSLDHNVSKDYVSWMLVAAVGLSILGNAGAMVLLIGKELIRRARLCCTWMRSLRDK